MTPPVIATIVSHGQRDLLARTLEALRRDGVPAALLANLPDGSERLAEELGARAGLNPEPRSFAVNQNALIAATDSRYVLVLNPDTTRIRARSPAWSSTPTPTRAAASPGRSCSNRTGRCSARAAASRR